MTEPKRQRIDWEAVKRDFRVDKYTDTELAALHKVSRETISRKRTEDEKVGKKGWEKDLREAINRATDTALVNAIVTEHHTKVTDVILVTAEMNTQVILKHRSDIKRTSDLAMAMLDELALTTSHQGELQELFEKITPDSEDGALEAAQRAFRGLMQVHNRVGSVHKLADTLTKLQTLERRAHNIGDTLPSPPDPTLLEQTDEGIFIVKTAFEKRLAKTA